VGNVIEKTGKSNKKPALWRNGKREALRDPSWGVGGEGGGRPKEAKKASEGRGQN